MKESLSNSLKQAGNGIKLDFTFIEKRIPYFIEGDAAFLNSSIRFFW